MTKTDESGIFAFRGTERVAAGDSAEVAVALHRLFDAGESELVLVFDAEGRQLDLDLSGSLDDVRRRFGASEPGDGEGTAPRRRGRPKLGVVGREVTLLPRHWQWLESQRGGPSATLRRLVDEARETHRERDRVHRAQDAINRFLSSLGGDLPGYEEATRALYRGERERFEAEISGWPRDLRAQVAVWLEDAFAAPGDNA